MKNRKGQALVEFVIILPIFILMILGVIDVGKIIFNQTNLENKVEDMVEMYKNDKTYDDMVSFLEKDTKNTELVITNENNEYVQFELIKKLEILTPGLNLILKNPYPVSVKRVIYYEK